MKVHVQYVSHASVENGSEKEVISQGYVCLVGFSKKDTLNKVAKMAQKLLHLRTIPNDKGKIDKSIVDISGDILLIPQFTLYADTQKGHRPSFSNSASPDLARALFLDFKKTMQSMYPQVKSGFFQTHMKLSLTNDGPITVLLEV